jgi:hypothetical protein
MPDDNPHFPGEKFSCGGFDIRSCMRLLMEKNEKPATKAAVAHEVRQLSPKHA